jgi:hypothetical protein
VTFVSGRRSTVAAVTTMRISQLAERSGVPATTLRFYEATGLLPAARNPAGYRLYGEEAVERLAFIGAAKHLDGGGEPCRRDGRLVAVLFGTGGHRGSPAVPRRKGP